MSVILKNMPNEEKFNIISNEYEYQLALVEIDRLIKIGPVEDSKEFLELDRISTIVEAYEEFHYTIWTLT